MKKMFIIVLMLVPLMGKARIEEKCAEELKKSECGSLKGRQRMGCLKSLKVKSEICRKEMQIEEKLFRQLGKPCFNDIQLLCKPYGRNDLETCLFNEQERFFGECKKLVIQLLRFRNTP